MVHFRSLFLLILGLALGASLSAALAWVDPTAAPPAGNAPAPINISNVTQTKEGGFNIAADAAAKVGIGVANPQNKLDVEGAAVIGATYSGTNIASANGLLVEGNVGIGISSPGSLLDVGSGGYLQFRRTSAGAPSATDCDNDAERGRLVIDTTNNRLYVCNGATRGWDYVALTD